MDQFRDYQFEVKSKVLEMNSQNNSQYMDILNFHDQGSSRLELLNYSEVQSNRSELKSPTSNEMASLISQERASKSDSRPNFSLDVESNVSETNSQPRKKVTAADILNLYGKCLSDLELSLKPNSNIIQDSLKKLKSPTRYENSSLNWPGRNLKSNACSQNSQDEIESNVPEANSQGQSEEIDANTLSLYAQCDAYLKLVNSSSIIEIQSCLSELRSKTSAGLNLQDSTLKSNRLPSNSAAEIESGIQEKNAEDGNVMTGLDSLNFYEQSIAELKERLNHASDIQVTLNTRGLHFQGNSSIGKNSFNLFQCDNQNRYEYPFHSNTFLRNSVLTHAPVNFIYNLPMNLIQYQLTNWDPMNAIGTYSPVMYSLVARNSTSLPGTTTQTQMNGYSSEIQSAYTLSSEVFQFTSNTVAQNIVPRYGILNSERFSPSSDEQHLASWNHVNTGETVVPVTDIGISFGTISQTSTQIGHLNENIYKVQSPAYQASSGPLQSPAYQASSGPLQSPAYQAFSGPHQSPAYQTSSGSPDFTFETSMGG